MPRMAAPANVAALEKPEGKAGERGDAVIALLAGDRDMVEAERAELKLRKLALDAFDLLQAEHVWLVGLDETGHEIEPQPHRIDVPGGKAKSHGLWRSSKASEDRATRAWLQVAAAARFRMRRAFLTTSSSIRRLDRFAVVLNEKMAVAMTSPPSSSGERSST